MMSIRTGLFRTTAFPVLVPEVARQGLRQRWLLIKGFLGFIEYCDPRRSPRDGTGVVVRVRAFLVRALAFPVAGPEEACQASTWREAGAFFCYVVVVVGVRFSIVVVVAIIG